MADKWNCIFPFLFASFLPVTAIAQASPNQAPERTWITDVRIISPEKLDHIEKGGVLILANTAAPTVCITFKLPVICPIADWTWEISASSASCTGTLFVPHVGPPWQMLP